MSGILHFRHQERVVYDRPFIEAVVEEANRLGAVRLFLTTSPSIARSKTFQNLVEALGDRHVGTFGEIRPNSLREDVLAGAVAARSCNADLIVAVGGGSVIDATKVMQLCLWNNLLSVADLDGFRAPEGQVAKPEATSEADCLPRIVAVPTLLSGAEFTHFAGVTDAATGRKEAYEHSLMIPRVVILDPDLLAASPAGQITTTGARALDHCIETFCSSSSMPYYDALALEGLRLLWRSLPLIHGGAGDREVYMDALYGAWLAIAPPAAGVPVGASHALARVIGSLCGVSHGHGSAVMQPAVLRWNARDAKAKARQQELMARAEIGGDNLADSVEAFLRGIGQPTRLPEVSVDAGRFDTIADYGIDMLRHPSVIGNARQITGRDDVLEILEEASRPVSAGRSRAV